MELALLAGYAGIGALAGLFAGLLGIGGGVIMAPLLLMVFEAQGASPENAALGALATSVAAIMFTSIPSALVHARHQAVSWRDLAWISPLSLLAAAAAAQLALRLPPSVIVSLLALFLAHTIWTVLRSRPAAAPGGAAARLGRWHACAIGALAGVVGALTGTGGGIVVSGMMFRAGLPLIVSIGTSSGNTLVVAAGASASYSGVGVDLPALLAMAPSCMVMAAVGARLANVMPRRALQLVYAGLLLLIVLRLCLWLFVE